MSSKLKSPNRAIVLRYYPDRTESKYFVGNYFGDFQRKVCGPFGGFVDFTIRDFDYELHTASAVLTESRRQAMHAASPAFRVRLS
jgi:hypothetical protein